MNPSTCRREDELRLWGCQAARQANWLYQLPKWILQSDWHYASWPQVISYEWKARVCTGHITYPSFSLSLSLSLPLSFTLFVLLSAVLHLKPVPYLCYCLCIWAALGSDSLTCFMYYIFVFSYFWSRTACRSRSWRCSFNKHSFTLSDAHTILQLQFPL